MSEGKVSPGQDFNPPPAAIWNNMVDAGRAFADGRLSNPAGNPVRPRETDIIKVKNDCGAARRKGEILKIDGKAIETVVDEQIWLLGKAVTADCYFGILKRPVEIDGVESVQVSGVCMALVDITDVDHTRANCVAGSYVLESSDSGPIEILYAPAETGEQDCVVRFTAGAQPFAVILDADLAVATNSKTGATSGLATVLTWDDSLNDYSETETQVTVWNHSETTAFLTDTIGAVIRINRHYWFFGDCAPMATRGV